MSGAEHESADKWTLGVRLLSNQIPRASVRTTLTYRLHPRLSVGVEYNPRADDVHFLANFVAVTETARRPALILGTSSDRIGTPSGTSYFATVSKNLSEAVNLPVSAYAGAAYSSYEDRFLPLAGVTVNWTESLSSLVIFDGVKVHPTLSYTLRQRHVFTFLLAQGRNPGVSYSVSF
ncbi:MAG TPA: hypothetical protein VE262_25290 [Blastocatellia bacterium]|nr:hypothetical protein [Blastocatellia bacterium]